MVTREIPRDEWAEFFDELSSQDEAALVTVEALGGDVGDQLVARDLRLQGITVEEKGSDRGQIEIMLGDDPVSHIAHVITTPTRVFILETEDGEPQTLQIEAEDAPTTLVHFRPFSETGILDGTAGLEDDE
ncbi:MAG: DUF5335 family protein [Armatimonadetes bacterium]|nr:DUF5335 family protein [Armatimonadota bacterium]